jgi:hypothetical protein
VHRDEVGMCGGRKGEAIINDGGREYNCANEVT